MKKLEAREWLKSTLQNNPEDVTLRYLYARNLFNGQKYIEAIEELRDLKHPFALIQAEIHRVSAAACWYSNQLSEAEKNYRLFQDVAPNSGEYERAQEWIERIKWEQKQQVK